MLLVNLEVLFRKNGSLLYLTKNRKNLSQDTINLVKAFHEDDAFSGKTDCVSVFCNTHR